MLLAGHRSPRGLGVTVLCCVHKTTCVAEGNCDTRWAQESTGSVLCKEAMWLKGTTLTGTSCGSWQQKTLIAAGGQQPLTVAGAHPLRSWYLTPHFDLPNAVVIKTTRTDAVNINNQNTRSSPCSGS
jgi:hypothetical protein